MKHTRLPWDTGSYINHERLIEKLDRLNDEVTNCVTVEGVRFYRTWTSKRTFGQAMTDDAKVLELAALMSEQSPLPRLIAADYGDSVLMIDGHHRAEAAKLAHCILYVWLCDGSEYDALSCRLGSFEADNAILEALEPYIQSGI